MTELCSACEEKWSKVAALMECRYANIDGINHIALNIFSEIPWNHRWYIILCRKGTPQEIQEILDRTREFHGAFGDAGIEALLSDEILEMMENDRNLS